MDYKEKVFKFLDELEPGAKVELDYSLKHTEKFIEIVKQYIDSHPYGNGIEFNQDYTKVKKQKFFDRFNKNEHTKSIRRR